MANGGNFSSRNVGDRSVLRAWVEGGVGEYEGEGKGRPEDGT